MDIMKIPFESFYDSLNHIKSISYKKNQYWIKKTALKDKNGNSKSIPTPWLHTFAPERLVVEEKPFNDKHSQIVVNKLAVERFHPNNINNKDFWVAARERFPLLSICGAECKNIEGANKNTLGIPFHNGFIEFLNICFAKSPEKLNFLEIGFGYGNLFHKIKDMCHYYGIDYVIPRSLKRYRNFYEIEQSGIPDFYLDENIMDIVYAVNVFQHCSQKDRFDYISQAYRALKPGGFLMFTEFLATEENLKEPCWGVIDESGRPYVHFFNQLTECDYETELKAHIQSVGFNIRSQTHPDHHHSFILQK